MAGFDGSDRPPMDSAQAIMRGALAEFLAMMLFVYFGCGSAASNAEKNTRNFTLADGSSVAVSEWNPASVTIIALQFGLGITVLAYFCAHSSGGHINCAVTWALVLVGKCHPVTGFVYFVAQMLGSIAGALLLKFTTFANSDGHADLADRSGGLGANGLQLHFTAANGDKTQFITPSMAVLGEVMGTMLLVLVVLETACASDSFVKNSGKGVAAAAQQLNLAPIPIGFAVFMAHVNLIPLTGCSINPTRSFGPSLVADSWDNHWIWWVGPLTGATIASLLWALIRSPAMMPPPAPKSEAQKYADENAAASNA